MDAFESLLALLLWREGYWVRSGFKVELTKAEKRMIGRASSPRWELDLVAYKGAHNELLVIECKSFLDSPGVRYAGFDGSNERFAKRYKLFNDRTLRKVVLSRLVKQLLSRGACSASPTVKLGLAAGRIVSDRDRENLRGHFGRNGWLLMDEAWLVQRLRTLADAGYENDVATVVTKLLMRHGAKIDASNDSVTVGKAKPRTASSR